MTQTAQNTREHLKETPHTSRRGWLKNGNQPGDFSKAPRCGAKNRRGAPCQCPAMPNGRCRLHGGLSTGARTAEGIQRIRDAVTKHGRYSAAYKAEELRVKNLIRKYHAINDGWPFGPSDTDLATLIRGLPALRCQPDPDGVSRRPKSSTPQFNVIICKSES
jgi:hypothetical protein